MRSLEEINQDYTNVCSKLGDLEVNYQRQKAMLMEAVHKLSLEAAEAKKVDESDKEQGD